MTEKLWKIVAPETPIDFYTLVLAIATIGLWLFTWRMARSSRDTVRSFVDVERADIVITLENFSEQPDGQYDPATGSVNVTKTWLKFDLVANNIGRSSALITHVAHGWYDSDKLPEGAVFTGPPRTYIAKAGMKTLLTLDSLLDVKDLESARYLWLLITYRSPLHQTDRVIRTCLEVWGVGSNIPYRQRVLEEFDSDKLRRLGRWNRLRTKLLARWGLTMQR